jgi:dienelactone hydrolase
MMKRRLLVLVAATALAVGATPVLPSLAAAQTSPPMSGGFTNVIPIPVDDPETKAIAGALLKPEGAGPFPAVVNMIGCVSLVERDRELEKAEIDHLLAKGVATLIVDPFTARFEPAGLCSDLTKKTYFQYATRGGSDAVAALKVLKTVPDIDPNRVFLLGRGLGETSALVAADPKTPGSRGRRRDRVLSLLL